MNSYLLQCALRAHLTPALAHLPLCVKQRLQPVNEDPGTEVLRSAKIYIGDVWPKQAGAGENVPFLCLQERGGHDEESLTRVEILLRCAVYSPEPETAVHELSNLVSTVRHAIMPLSLRPLEARYRLLTDEKNRLLAWETPTEQNHPYAEAYILSVWEYKSMEGVML